MVFSQSSIHALQKKYVFLKHLIIFQAAAINPSQWSLAKLVTLIRSVVPIQSTILNVYRDEGRTAVIGDLSAGVTVGSMLVTQVCIDKFHFKACVGLKICCELVPIPGSRAKEVYFY